jgi:hypothetical protein
MNCKNLKIRSKNYEKKFYCIVKKEFINIEECKNCLQKENKIFKKAKIKTHKVSKMAKACEISRKVKERVYERDHQQCIFCKKYVELRNACCHYVPRSLGGLGIEENIFTACDECHVKQDNGLNTKIYDKEAEKYLKNCYKNWSIDKLIYKKY